MKKLVFILAVIACATCQSTVKQVDELQIEKLSKVMRPSDPTGRNHNTKVIIAPHKALNNVVRWQLILRTLSKETVNYNLNVDGTHPTTRREFIFEGNLQESDTLYLRAKNSLNGTVAETFLTLRIKDLGSNVAWVGAGEDSAEASLRVNASTSLKEIMVDRRVCKLENSPCYYIMPKPKPILGDRCVDVISGTGEMLEVCDERVIAFKEMSQRPTLSLEEDGRLLVETTHNTSYKRIEVVVFDPEDRTNVFSDNGSTCLIEVNTLSSTGQKVQCHHEFTKPEEQTKLKVLVVRLNDTGVVLESSLLDFDTMPPEDKDMTGIIVGSVIGSLVGLALIILLVLFFMKKKDKKSSTSGSTAQYTPANTNPTDA